MRFKREIGEKGQVVIPKDIRDMLGLKPRQKVIFEIEMGEVKVKAARSAEEIVEDFCNVPKSKKKISVNEMKEMIEEQYELPRR